MVDVQCTMAKYICLCLIFLFCANVNSQEADPVIDISTDPWIFRSTELPDDIKTYATIGNGHVATVMHRDSVFMNGLYNGLRGYSHRARIPSRNNIAVVPASGMENAGNHTYELDVKQGVYTESFEVGSFVVKVRTFAHRFYHTVIFTQIVIEKIGTGTEPLLLKLVDNRGDASEDISFEDAVAFDIGTIKGFTQCGYTNEVEDAAYQNSGDPQVGLKSTVCVTNRHIESTDLELTSSDILTYFTSYANTEDISQGEFLAVATHLGMGNDAQLFEEHAGAWENLWEDARIEVTGNLLVSKVINGALYYLLASLPITTPTFNPVGQFYGLSPGSLAFGSHDFNRPDIMHRPMDYQGHSFWDTETWMYPPILMLHPDKAQQLLNYRMNGVKAARDRAVRTGNRGARFPWESGYTGREVTPDCCEETRDLQIHVSADIMYAFRQYVASTRDYSWLTDKKEEHLTNPCGLIREVADFFVSRTCYNQNGFHDIKGVMPPDEDNYNNTVNNGYTNVMAGYAIFFAKYAECLCAGKMEPVPEDWLNVARSLAFLYNEEEDYHPEFEGFDINSGTKSIKQADVVLLGYPVMYGMEQSTRKNDLELYEKITREDGPAMTWAMHTIGWLELGDEDRAAELFERSYTRYMRQPFKTWTEAIYPNSGAHNFITGMGGFLQSIVNGYAGIRLKTESLVIRKPYLIPNSDSLKIVGLKYLGNKIDYTVVSDSSVEIELTEANEDYPLYVVYDGANLLLELNKTITVDTALIPDFVISTDKNTECPVPEDVIGINLNPDNKNGGNLGSTLGLGFIGLLLIEYLVSQCM